MSELFNRRIILTRFSSAYRNSTKCTDLITSLGVYSHCWSACWWLAWWMFVRPTPVHSRYRSVQFSLRTTSNPERPFCWPSICLTNETTVDSNCSPSSIWYTETSRLPSHISVSEHPWDSRGFILSIILISNASFTLTTVCNQLKAGIFAFVTPISGDCYETLLSYSNTFQVGADSKNNRKANWISLISKLISKLNSKLISKLIQILIYSNTSCPPSRPASVNAMRHRCSPNRLVAIRSIQYSLSRTTWRRSISWPTCTIGTT